MTLMEDEEKAAEEFFTCFNLLSKQECSWDLRLYSYSA